MVGGGASNLLDEIVDLVDVWLEEVGDLLSKITSETSFMFWLEHSLEEILQLLDVLIDEIFGSISGNQVDFSSCDSDESQNFGNDCFDFINIWVSFDLLDKSLDGCSVLSEEFFDFVRVWSQNLFEFSILVSEFLFQLLFKSFIISINITLGFVFLKGGNKLVEGSV